MPDVTQRQLEALIKGLAVKSFTHEQVLRACGGSAELLANWHRVFALAHDRGYVAKRGHVIGGRKPGFSKITYYLTDKGKNYARLIAEGKTDV